MFTFSYQVCVRLPFLEIKIRNSEIPHLVFIYLTHGFLADLDMYLPPAAYSFVYHSQHILQYKHRILIALILT